VTALVLAVVEVGLNMLVAGNNKVVMAPGPMAMNIPLWPTAFVLKFKDIHLQPL